MKQKIALITGARRGIGKAIRDHLLAEKWFVYGLSKNIDTFNHPQYRSLAVDLADLNKLSCELKKLQIFEIDVLICNAGMGRFGHLEQMSDATIQEMTNLNFLSPIFITKYFLPMMKKKQKGNIIYIGSEAALQGKRKGSIYCGCKFGIRGFSQALRDECRSSSVQVNLINPGMVKTEFFNQLDFEPGSDQQEHIDPHDVAKIVSMILHMRQGTVLDEINLSPHKQKITNKQK